MTRWLEIRDDEHKGKLARRVAANASQLERAAATSWRDTLVQRVRDRPLVVATDLPPEDEYYDYSSAGEDGEDVVMSGAFPAAMATVDDPIAVDEDDEVSDLFPVTPTPSSRGGRGRRNNGTRRGTRSSGSSTSSSKSRSSAAGNAVLMLVHIEEKRAMREVGQRKEQAEREERLEERREAREVEARQAAEAREEAMMRHMTAIMQVVVSGARREQPVQLTGDYPQQDRYDHQPEP